MLNVTSPEIEDAVGVRFMRVPAGCPVEILEHLVETKFVTDGVYEFKADKHGKKSVLVLMKAQSDVTKAVEWFSGRFYHPDGPDQPAVMLNPIPNEMRYVRLFNSNTNKVVVKNVPSTTDTHVLFMAMAGVGEIVDFTISCTIDRPVYRAFVQYLEFRSCQEAVIKLDRSYVQDIQIRVEHYTTATTQIRPPVTSNTSIYVCGLPMRFSTSQEFKALFSSVGEVVFANPWFKRNQFTGNGQVTFSNGQDAAEAITRFNGIQVDGSLLTVKPFRS